MTKFLTVTLLKYLIKFLRKMKNLIDKLTFSAAIPFFTKIKNSKFFVFLLKTLAFYKFIRITYSILGFSSILLAQQLLFINNIFRI